MDISRSSNWLRRLVEGNLVSTACGVTPVAIVYKYICAKKKTFLFLLCFIDKSFVGELSRRLMTTNHCMSHCVWIMCVFGSAVTCDNNQKYSFPVGFLAPAKILIAAFPSCPHIRAIKNALCTLPTITIHHSLIGHCTLSVKCAYELWIMCHYMFISEITRHCSKHILLCMKFKRETKVKHELKQMYLSIKRYA